MPSPRRLRNDLQTLTAEAESDIRIVWREVKTPGASRAALLDILPALIDQYGIAASTLAAEFYDDYRIEAQVGGSFTASPAVIAKTGTEQLVGWSLTQARDMTAFQTLLLGGVQRRILNFSRSTMADSSLADPKASGWVRVGVGECEWCQQYLDGEVRTVPGYDFPAHDWCKCDAVPAL